jgi:hypothetical protein
MKVGAVTTYRNYILGMAGNIAYEDQATDYILTSSIVYKVTLTSIDMIKFAK